MLSLRALNLHVLAPLLAFAIAAVWPHPVAAQWTVIGWNDLGMHCMDADFSVFAILPPYNTFHAQVIGPDGKLKAPGSGVGVGYRATVDPAGSINSTSVGRTNFWQYCPLIFGTTPAPDQGLAGFLMPGAANAEQPMAFDAVPPWFSAVGVPITPYDDAADKNPYPMMRLTARDGVGSALASTDIVLPVSDEMDCRACHASGSGPAARPAAGWVFASDAQVDYRLNILRLHDERQHSNPAFAAALQALALDPAGLYASATAAHKPMLCAACHASNALPGTGIAGIAPLTEAMHGGHAGVVDPLTAMTLDDSGNRSACYRCHPGSTTQCLRGAMGRAVAADGTLAMQCQSCHGSMSLVGTHGRAGWLEEPRCDNCHTGTATHNSGQIRYTDAFSSPGVLRSAADATFATNDGAPGPGLSLYRFSFGHGGVACEACHGPTHAESPSTHANDNVQSLALQGHEGVIAECGVCHRSAPPAGLGGPHGLHPLGSDWAGSHADFVEQNGNGACRNCHGTDLRGGVLSAMQADRVIATTFGTKTLWRGERIGCYLCHDGPASETATTNHPPVVTDRAAATTDHEPLALTLGASDADGNALTLRIVDQPVDGTVAFDGTTATYHPPLGFSGQATFTYAAWDGKSESNLGHVSLSVTITDPIFANGFE